MDKSKTKKSYDAVKALSVKSTAQAYACTEAYVRMCISGDAKNGRSDEIKKYFTNKYSELKNTLNN